MKNLILTTKIEVYSLEELLLDEKELIEKAKNASKQAYAPYSSFQVGCAVQLLSGKIILGSNQENAAYTAGICAERTALNYATSTYPNDYVTKIAIVAQSHGQFIDTLCTPCGECRQVILEVENRSHQKITILLSKGNEIYKMLGIETLLPFGFHL